MKTINHPMVHHKSTIVFMIILSFIVILAMLTSCESKSGQRTPMTPQKMEKVVVISTPIYVSHQHRHKVKRIEKGVVTYIYLSTPFSVGDTILYPFSPNY